MEDKEKKFIGTNDWIGAFEVNLCLNHFLGVNLYLIPLD